MNFNSRIAKIGRGKFVNAYKNSDGNICIYLNNKILLKKYLTDGDAGFELQPQEFDNGCSEIIKISDNIFVERIQTSIKVVTSDE